MLGEANYDKAKACAREDGAKDSSADIKEIYRKTEEEQQRGQK
jgi:hypothetical protein